MKILLLSDTHGYIDDAILRHVADADMVLHAGDIGNLEVINKLKAIKPLQAVYGNIDGQPIRQQYPLDNRFTLDGLDIWMTHIGGYTGHYDRRVLPLLKINPPDLFICGHSHILRVMKDLKFQMLCMNPGAAGIQGFHQMRTMIRFTVSQGNILEPAVIELGKRGAI